MNCELIVKWPGPTGIPDEDRAFLDAVEEMVRNALLDLNRALRDASCPTGNFVIATHAS
jgi:hypothetical protein